MEDRQPDFLINVPLFEVISNPTIKISDIKKRRFYIDSNDNLLERIARAHRIAEPLVDIEDYTDEKFWPEWCVSDEYGEDVFVKARTEAEAQRAADDLRSQG